MAYIDSTLVLICLSAIFCMQLIATLLYFVARRSERRALASGDAVFDMLSMDPAERWNDKPEEMLVAPRKSALASDIEAISTSRVIKHARQKSEAA